MAAYDLTVDKPGMLQIPNTFDKGAQNLMQFMRMQQEQRNNQDRLALDQQRVANTAKDTQADNLREDDKLGWLKGADQREIDTTIKRNQGITNALNTGKTSLASDFSISEENLAQLYNDPRFAAMAPEEQKSFIDKSQGMFRQMKAQDIGPEYLFNSLVKNLTNSGASFEESQSIAENEISKLYPDLDAARLKMLTEMGGKNLLGTGRSSGKGVPLDDTSKMAAQNTEVENFMKTYDVEDESRFFKSLTDWGGDDLTRPDVENYSSTMLTQYGLPKATALNALKGSLDGDALASSDLTLAEISNAGTLGMSKEQFIRTDLSNPKLKATPAHKELQKILATGTALQNQQQSGSGQNQEKASEMVNFLSRYQTPKQKASNKRLSIILAQLPAPVQDVVDEALKKEAPKPDKEGKVDSSKPTPLADAMSKVASSSDSPTNTDQLIKDLEKRIKDVEGKKILAGKSSIINNLKSKIEDIKNVNNAVSVQPEVVDPKAQALRAALQEASSRVMHPQDTVGVQAVQNAKANLDDYLLSKG